MTSKDKRKRQKRLHIIEASSAVFAAKGFTGTVMADIALAACVGKGTIYEYFASKDDLFFAVFEWFIERTANAVRLRMERKDRSAAEKLLMIVDTIVSFGVEVDDYFTLSMEFWAASAASPQRTRFADVFHETYREFRGLVGGVMQEGVVRGEFSRDVDCKALAAGLVGSLDGIFLQAWFDPSFDPKRTAEKVTQCLIRGMLAEQEVV